MKKLLAILISIFLAVSFTGCNQDDDESTSTETVTGTQGETKPTESGNTSQGETKPTESENTSQEETKPAEGENTSQGETKPAEGENTSQEETKPAEGENTSQEETKPAETLSLSDTYWSSADAVMTDETGLTTVTIKEQMFFSFLDTMFFWYDVEKNDYQNALNSLPSELNNETPSASKKLSRSLYDSGVYTVEGRTIKFSRSSYSNAVELTLSEDLQSFVLTETYNGQTYKITFNRIESRSSNAVVTMTLNPTDDTSEIAGCWVLEDIEKEDKGLKITMQAGIYITCDEKNGTMYTFDGIKRNEAINNYRNNPTENGTYEDKTVDIPYSTKTRSISYFKIGSKITIASMNSDGTISYLIGTLSEDKKSITIPLEDEEDGTTEIIYTKVETVPENAKLTIEVLPTSSEPAADTSPSLNISSMNLNLLGKGR